jgi:dihydroorotase
VKGRGGEKRLSFYMSCTLIKNATIVNEGKTFRGDLLIKDEYISAIGSPGLVKSPARTKSIDAAGLFLIPGVIDDQVHFREPGLTYKGDIFSETRAAAAGGITSFMDMPNTIPQTVTIEALNRCHK